MIDGKAALRAVVESARGRDGVGLDTELVWERTFYPHLGVVQLSLSREECHLLDAPALGDLTLLGELLADGDAVKILHDAPQDLTILRRATGAAPRRIFDTQAAAGFAGLSSTISLRDLVRELVGVELHKTETRTDWLQRPLSDTQVQYAEDDVRYLPEIRRQLLDRARERGVEAWLEEEMRRLDDPALYEERDPGEQYRRVKGAGRLDRRQLAVLRELARWREEVARQQDRPRGRVATDGLLLHLAQRQPQRLEELAEVRGLRDRHVARYGEGLLAAVARGLAMPVDECPPGPPRSRFDPGLEDRVDRALSRLKDCSAARGIDHALVATRAEVVQLMRRGAAAEGSRLLRGWRAEFVGNDLLESGGRA
ncbi:MAG: HRDC domain-containing protein [Gemmatimonadota bacterium]